MAYTSGIATDVNALGTAVSTFLTANGWTVDYHMGDAGVPDVTNLNHSRTVVDGTMTVNYGIAMGFRQNINDGTLSANTGNYILAMPFDTFNDFTGEPFYANNGTTLSAAAGYNPLVVAFPIPVTSISYWFFCDADGSNVVLVVQYTTGVFSYLGFGYAQGTDRFGWGSGLGGQYCYANRSGKDSLDTGSFGSDNQGVNCPPLPPGYINTKSNWPTMFVKVNADSSGLVWYCNVNPGAASTSQSTGFIVGGWQGANSTQLGDNVNQTNGGGLPDTLHLWARSPSASAQNIIAVPCLISVWRVAQQRWSPLCRLPLIRAAVTAGAINEGAQISIGSDTFRAFNSFIVQDNL